MVIVFESNILQFELYIAWMVYEQIKKCYHQINYW